MNSTTPTGTILNGAELEGAGGKGSRQATRTPDNLLSQDYVELLLAFGEGPIGGVQGDEDKRALRNVYLGETPLENADGKANFNDFKATLFYGRDNDPPVERVLGGDASNLSVGTPLAQNTPVIRTTPALYRKTEEGTGIMRLEIRIMFQQLFKTNDSGDYEHFARFQISYKPSNTTTWVHYKGEDELQITGKTTSGYVKDFLIDVTPLADADYDIRVTKLSPDNGTQEIVEMVWESVQMVTMARPKFPGLAMLHLWGRVSDQFSSLPDISAVLHGIELEVPTNYNPVTRTYDESSPWNGTTKKAFTNNPAWVLYYLLTNPVHGLARYYKNVSVNRYEFYNAAKWCDEQVPAHLPGQTQPRFTFNEVLNTRKLGFETLLYIAGSFNSTLLDRGDGVIRLRTDQYRTPKMIFSPENVVNGEFNYSVADITTRVNEVTVRFINPDLGWVEDQRSASIDASEWQAKNGIIPYDFQAVGCTNAHEAIRRANDRLLTANTEVTSVSFETSRLGVFLEPFDIVYIADPVSGWSTGGRIKSVVGAVVHLRDPIYFATTTPVTMRLMTVEGLVTLTVQPAATGAVYSLTITAGTITGTLPDRAVFTLEDTNDFGIAKPFRVMEIDSLEGDGNHFRISAVEVNVNKYGDSASGTLSDPVEYDFTTPGEPKLPSVLVIANAPPLISADGSLTYRLRASWDMPFQAFTSHYELEYSEVDSGVWTTLIVYGEEAYVQPLRSGARYNFRLFAISPLGKRSRRSVQANNILVAAKAAVLQNVIGLAVFNNTLGWEVSWQPPTEIPDYDGVELRVGATSNTWGTLSTAYRTYSNTQILPWLPAGVNRIFAKYVDTTGNESAVAQSTDLTVSNPAAPVITSLRTVVGTVEIEFSDCTTSQPLKQINIRVGDTWDTATQIFTVAGNQRSLSLVFETSGAKKILLRAEDVAGNIGPEGVATLTLNIRDSLLDQIGDLPEAEVVLGSITSDHLYKDLGDRINLIDAEGTGLLQQVENLKTTYGDTVSSAENAAAAIEAQAAADIARIAAQAAAAAAGDAEVAAVQAKADAILAEGAAETAAAVAGEARSGAIQARADAILANDAAQLAKTASESARTTAEQQAVISSTAASTAGGHASTATIKAGEAATSASNAAGSASSAATYSSLATQASNAASQAAATAQIASEDAVSAAVTAASSASSATSAKTLAVSSANSAGTSASDAKISQQNSVKSASDAAGSAATAASERTLATTARNEASGFATTATNKASEAATSAADASGSASTATTARELAVAARNEAQGHASTATNKASEAATAASNAQGSAASAESSRLLAVEAASSATQSAATASIAATDAVEAAITANASFSAASAAKTIAVSSANAAGTSAADAQIFSKDSAKSATTAAGSAATATSERELATAARDAAQGHATTATNKASESVTSASNAAGSASAAETARSLATTAASNASASATTATNKATESASSASNAAGSASQAESSRFLAAEAASTATTQAATAAISAEDAVNAAISATAAASTATSAKTLAVSAANEAGTHSANASIKYKDTVKSATDAATSASQASSSKDLAAGSATTAGNHANAALGYSQTASSKATEASSSAAASEAARLAAEARRNEAEGFANSANTHAGTASAHATTAGNSASASQTSRLAAESARDAASGSASAASSSAGAASASATTAGQHASSASSHANNASTSAGTAQTYAGQAATSATNAAGSASSAASSLTQIKAISVTEFRAKQTWEFKNSIEDFQVNAGTLTAQPNSLILTGTASDTFLIKHFSAFSGAEFDKVRVRFRHIGGDLIWEGTLYYATTDRYWHGGFQKTIPKPENFVANGGWVVAEWDMELLTAGGLDWKQSQITGLRFDFDASSNSVYEIDWVSIGRHSTPTSEAEIFTLQQVLQNADTANATKTTALIAALGGSTAASTDASFVSASANGGLFAQRTLKMDLNGYVSGIGLASEAPVNGSPSSSVIIRADRFAVGAPGVASIVPLAVVQNHPTIPTGVYIQGAYIDGRGLTIRDGDGKVLFGVNTRIPSPNLIPNSDQSSAISMVIGWNPYGATFEWPLRYANEVWGDYWSMPAGNTKNLILSQSNRLAQGNNALAVQVYPSPNRIPVVAGKRYCFSVYLGAHRCFGQIGMEFFNRAGALLLDPYTPVTDIHLGAGDNLNNYHRLFVIVDAPAEAAFCFPVIHKMNTHDGQTQSYMWIVAPQLEQVTENAAGPGPYNPGPAANTRQLGFSGDLNATYGATWNSNLASQPAENLLRNDQIKVQSGALVGIGEGAGTAVANTLLQPEINKAMGENIFYGSLQTPTSYLNSSFLGAAPDSRGTNTGVNLGIGGNGGYVHYNISPAGRLPPGAYTITLKALLQSGYTLVVATTNALSWESSSKDVITTTAGSGVWVTAKVKQVIANYGEGLDLVIGASHGPGGVITSSTPATYTIADVVAYRDDSIDSQNRLTNANKNAIGYAGDLNATYGATWGSTLAGRPPDNQILNTAIGVNANGDIYNIGPGDGTRVANNQIAIDSRGAIQGIGAGAGQSVSNYALTENIIPDWRYADPVWWSNGAVTAWANIGSVTFTDIQQANKPVGAIEFNPASIDFSSKYMAMEVGATYRLRIWVFRTPNAAGIFWAGMHRPGEEYGTPVPYNAYSSPESGWNLSAIPLHPNGTEGIWTPYSYTFVQNWSQLQMRIRNVLTAGTVFVHFELIRVPNLSAPANNKDFHGKLTADSAPVFIDNGAINSALIGSLTAANISVQTMSDVVKGGSPTTGRIDITSNKLRVFDNNNIERVTLGYLL